jgi:hypothetical protein
MHVAQPCVSQPRTLSFLSHIYDYFMLSFFNTSGNNKDTRLLRWKAGQSAALRIHSLAENGDRILQPALLLRNVRLS